MEVLCCTKVNKRRFLSGERMKQFFKRLFCKHDYIKIDWYQTFDNNIRYSRRQYMCKKCGKKIWVDGRYDKIGK